MAKIVLDVNDKHLKTVTTILESLKAGLINNISSQNSKPTSSSLNDNKPNTGKYMSKKSYKMKLTKEVIKDEFMDTNPSSGKYLNANAYKAKLKK